MEKLTDVELLEIVSAAPELFKWHGAKEADDNVDPDGTSALMLIHQKFYKASDEFFIGYAGIMTSSDENGDEVTIVDKDGNPDIEWFDRNSEWVDDIGEDDEFIFPREAQEQLNDMSDKNLLKLRLAFQHPITIPKALREHLKQKGMAEKIYISAPITGHNLEERKKYFSAIATRLEEYGYEPVNPLDGIEFFQSNHFDSYNNRPNHDDYMKRDLMLLTTCDSILLCPRWEHSDGCRLEFEVARGCGMGVSYLRDGSLDTLKLFPEGNHIVCKEQI